MFEPKLLCCYGFIVTPFLEFAHDCQKHFFSVNVCLMKFDPQVYRKQTGESVLQSAIVTEAPLPRLQRVENLQDKVQKVTCFICIQPAHKSRIC